MHQNKNNPHILQEISTNILTKMSDITGNPHWACSEKYKQNKLVTENSVSTVCNGILQQQNIRLSRKQSVGQHPFFRWDLSRNW